MNREQLAELKERAEKMVKDTSQMQTEEWKAQYDILGLVHMAERDSTIGDFTIRCEPDYPNYPNRLVVYIKGERKFNHVIEDPDVAMLFAVAYKHLGINDAGYFLKFALRALNIDGPWRA